MYYTLINIANSTIPKPHRGKQTRAYNGNTGDIVSNIIKDDKAAGLDLIQFAPHLMGETIHDTTRKIYDFVKNNIQYKKDDNEQLNQLPAYLWHTSKAGDCKSLSLFIAGLLRNLAIPYKYRFTSYDHDQEIRHVYVVAIDEPTGREYILDAVYDHYNKEKKPYTFKKDIEMVKIATIGDPAAQINGVKKRTSLHIATKVNPAFVAGRTAYLKLLAQNIQFGDQGKGIASLMYKAVTKNAKYSGSKVLVKNPIWEDIKNTWYNLGGTSDASQLANAMFKGAGKKPFKITLKFREFGRKGSTGKVFGVGEVTIAAISALLTSAAAVLVPIAQIVNPEAGKDAEASNNTPEPPNTNTNNDSPGNDSPGTDTPPNDNPPAKTINLFGIRLPQKAVIIGGATLAAGGLLWAYTQNSNKPKKRK